MMRCCAWHGMSQNAELLIYKQRFARHKNSRILGKVERTRLEPFQQRMTPLLPDEDRANSLLLVVLLSQTGRDERVHNSPCRPFPAVLSWERAVYPDR